MKKNFNGGAAYEILKCKVMLTDSTNTAAFEFVLRKLGQNSVTKYK